jgi:hypothetical protein
MQPRLCVGHTHPAMTTFESGQEPGNEIEFSLWFSLDGNGELLYFVLLYPYESSTIRPLYDR